MILDIPTAVKTYHVRMKGTQTAFPSANVSVTLAARTSAPSVSLNLAAEEISALNSAAMEWSFGDEGYKAIPAGMTKYSVSGDVDKLTAQPLVIHIRSKAEENRPSSKPRDITFYPRLAPPSAVAFDSQKKKVTGVASSMEYRVQGTASWVKISSSTLDVSSLLKTYNEAVLEVRYRYTAKNSSSKPVTVRIYNL